jgi:predicted RNA-binding Zn-ribbon protein involved in translation (DUF1610 family)
MSFLKTTCEQCGEIELPIGRVLLRIDERDEQGVCVFRCPTCGLRFVKEANDAMIVMLLAAGIEVSMWSSAVAGSAPDDLPAITVDDLETFRRHLGNDSELLRHLESI